MSHLYVDWLTSFHAKDITDLGIKINIFSVIFWSSSVLSWQFKMKNSSNMKCFCASDWKNWIRTLKLNFIVPALTANSHFNVSEMIFGETLWAALCSYWVKWCCCLFAAPADKGLQNTPSWWYTQNIPQPQMGQATDVFYTSGWKLTSFLILYPHKWLVWLGSEHGRDFCLLLEYCNVLIMES